jgi:PAS domain S-box-containing protein
MIVGAGIGGTAILRILYESKIFSVACVVDQNENAEGMMLAKNLGIMTASSWKDIQASLFDIIIEVTGNQQVLLDLLKSTNSLVIPGSIAFIMAQLTEEKKTLIDQLKEEKIKHDLIFNTTNDGMIVVDKKGSIILFNRSAERMTGAKQKEVMGKHIIEVIPDSRLPKVVGSNRMELHQEHVLQNGLKIITTRIPLLDDQQNSIGAIAVFKDITQAVQLAEQITDLKEVQTMLEAIIQSSDDAISVVDEKGRGLLINPAYTRIMGLKKEDVIGKHATADIYEGESMHIRVLKTRRAVRGVKMRVGPKKKEVIVNVAPIIVDGRLKGSVGIIHDVSEIKQLTEELNRARQIIRTIEAKYTFADIIGHSEDMQLSIEQAKLSAKTPATILLRGESGTGKELFAHAIHDASDRKYNKFVRVNCAAISESLLESELFGYEEGAFSGAKRGGKRGLFEEANNGSIFLDEIGELTASLQAKLLRVLQEKEIIRVGGTKPVSLNVRVIAATNRNLEKAISTGNFRGDLYFRLNRMPIYIPPLRKRKEDMQQLAEHVIRKINLEYGRNIEGITTQALSRLLQFDWPGNVRELENILGRTIIFMKSNETLIDEQHLPDFLETSRNLDAEVVTNIKGVPDSSEPLAELMDRYEREIIKKTLKVNAGNKTNTAKKLGISVRSLYYKIDKYNLDKYSMQ